MFGEAVKGFCKRWMAVASGHAGTILCSASLNEVFQAFASREGLFHEPPDRLPGTDRIARSDLGKDIAMQLPAGIEAVGELDLLLEIPPSADRAPFRNTGCARRASPPDESASRPLWFRPDRSPLLSSPSAASISSRSSAVARTAARLAVVSSSTWRSSSKFSVSSMVGMGWSRNRRSSDSFTRSGLGATVSVPRPARTSTKPRSSRIFMASRITIRLT